LRALLPMSGSVVRSIAVFAGCFTAGTPDVQMRMHHCPDHL
jgi:hypothetical protein